MSGNHSIRPSSILIDEFSMIWIDVMLEIKIGKGGDTIKLLSQKLEMKESQIKLVSWMLYHENEELTVQEAADEIGEQSEVVIMDISFLLTHNIFKEADDEIILNDNAMEALYSIMLDNESDINQVMETEEDLYKRVDILLDRIDIEDGTKEDILEQILSLCHRNSSMQFCKGIIELHKQMKSSDEFASLLVLSRHFRCKGLEDPYDSNLYKNGIGELVGAGLAIVVLKERDCNDNEDKKGYILAPKVCGKLFYAHPEYVNYSNILGQAEFVPSGSIEKKTLYFDDEYKSSLAMMSAIMEPNRFNEITSRMQKKGKNSCISILLYGDPGTGKTEIARQLARKTGRDILIAEPSKLNMSHIGQSEKMYRALFRNVKYLQYLSPNPPILLFNEADGILGKRINVNNSCDKLENTIQSILLQELENFDGIFIATTNLANNIDSAFERRFLLKVKFQKPSVNTRTKIIKSLMPSISSKIAHTIAERYDFSGGELENISKKCDLYEIVNSKYPSNKDILEMCEKEKIVTNSNNIRNTPIKGLLEYNN